MWARVAELMLGVWLVISPLVFRGTESVDSFAVRDLSFGAAVIALSLLSFWTHTRWAHLITAVLAVALGLMGYFGSERPGPPAAQNEIAIGMLLLLLAIVPNQANQPPPAWDRFPG
jgi:SPW repeat